jgi:hypothetical protein
MVNLKNKKDMCVLLCEKKKTKKKSSIMNNKKIILARNHTAYIQIKLLWNSILIET